MNDTRQVRLAGRHALRHVTTQVRCYDCGRATIGADIQSHNDKYDSFDGLDRAVGIRLGAAGVAGFAGLATCGLIWLCPVCNSKVMARRALEIGVAVAWAQNEGYRLIWGSLTVRHNAASDLSQLLDLQRSAWRRLSRSKVWERNSATMTAEHRHSPDCLRVCSIDHEHTPVCSRDCDRKKDTVLSGSDGRVAYIRAAEMSIGENGWHPHFHPLIVFKGTAQEAQDFADSVVEKWVESVEHYGGEARAEGGQQLKVLDGIDTFHSLGAYVTKQTYDAAAIALEITWSQNKTNANNGHKVGKKAVRTHARSTESHWSLLAKIAHETGEVNEAMERWFQLEEAVPGHRMITWSRGFRAFAGVGEEIADETLAAEEVGTKDDTVCFITAEGWMLLRDNPARLGHLLTTLEKQGWPSLQALLNEWGVSHYQLEKEEAR